MPEAVDSNSTVTSEIHLPSPADKLHDLSDVLQAHKVMMDCLIGKIDRGKAAEPARCVVKGLARQEKPIR